MKKNRTYSNQFKFKVSLEMVRGDLTLAEIISKYQIPRSVAHKWKKQLLDNGPEVFGTKNSNKNNTDSIEIEKLHATIGRLKVENDFLQLVSNRLKL